MQKLAECTSASYKSDWLHKLYTTGDGKSIVFAHQDSEKVLDHFNLPRNAGALENADAIGKSSRNGRAPYTHLFLKIDQGIVLQTGFQTFGCGYSIAACSAVTEMMKGKTIDQCKMIRVNDILAQLGKVPDAKRFCADLVVQAMFNALEKLAAGGQAAETNSEE